MYTSLVLSLRPELRHRIEHFTRPRGVVALAYVEIPTISVQAFGIKNFFFRHVEQRLRKKNCQQQIGKQQRQHFGDYVESRQSKQKRFETKTGVRFRLFEGQRKQRRQLVRNNCFNVVFVNKRHLRTV